MAQTTIQGSFLGDATVTGAKIGADFISAQTELDTSLATTDEIIVSDAGVIKRIDISVWSASTETFTNKTFDADGTGNSLTNIEVANLKSGVLDIDLSNAAGTDTTLASAKAIKAALDLKASIATPTFTTSITIGSATVTQAQLEILDGATVTTTELNRLANIDFNIKTQVDSKAPLASPVFTTSIRITPQTDAPSSPPEGTIYYDTEDKIAYIHNGSGWMALHAGPQGTAVGGDDGDYSGYKVHIFNDVSATENFVISSGAITCDILVIAGGGGGAGNNHGAGGGAGGFIYYSQKSLAVGTYTITCGAKGVGGDAGSRNHTEGTDSTITGNFSITAVGGGKAGWEGSSASNAGTVGGSGGGAGSWHSSAETGAAGTTNQGNKGGDVASSVTTWQGTGGGGGAGGEGQDGTGDNAGSNSGVGGAGGAGYTEGNTVYNWNGGSEVEFPTLFKEGTGSNLGYCGGGGGSGNYSGGAATHGGGAGSTGAGADATGYGAGGGGSARGSGSVDGGDGSQGIVIIRYAI